MTTPEKNTMITMVTKFMCNMFSLHMNNPIYLYIDGATINMGAILQRADCPLGCKISMHQA